MNFKAWIRNRTNEIKSDLALESYNIEVFENKEFTKPLIDPMSIMVVYKFLTSEKIFQTQNIPFQLMIMSEENSDEATNLIFTKFAQKYNWYSFNEGTTNYKIQLSTPTPVNNFNSVGGGQRSIFLMSGTMYVLENVVDVKDFKIDSVIIPFIDFAINYVMSCDTQAFPGSNRLFAESVKSVQTMVLSVTIPCISSTFMTNLLPILNGTSTGNRTFNLTFTLGGVNFSINTKVTNVLFKTAPNSVPGFVVDFSR